MISEVFQFLVALNRRMERIAYSRTWAILWIIKSSSFTSDVFTACWEDKKNIRAIQINTGTQLYIFFII
jgi:hypothetical protein